MSERVMTPDHPPSLRSPQPRPVTPTTILAEELTDLYTRVDAGLDRSELLEALRRVRDLAGGLDPYVERCTSPESSALASLASRTREVDWGATGPLEQEMLSGHVEGRALNFLIRMSRARRVLEIGMFTGYSALAMAEALPEGGSVLALELDEAAAALARECFDASPVGHRITVATGPAQDSLRRLMADPQGEPFDFVFIDADKAGYWDYVHLLLDSELLAPDGVIAVDNTLMQGQPYTGVGVTANGEAIAAFNEAVIADPRIEQVMLPLRDGVTLIRRV